MTMVFGSTDDDDLDERIEDMCSRYRLLAKSARKRAEGSAHNGKRWRESIARAEALEEAAEMLERTF